MLGKLFEINEVDLEEVKFPEISTADFEVYVLRIDKLHNEISGNKWFKLKYNLLEAEKLNHKTLLTFGGAYSNHIYAVASAGKEFGFDTIGIIRGEEYFPLNPTLQFAVDCGMKLFYLNRAEYKNRNDKAFQEKLKIKFDNPYMIPEGGTNQLALMGTEEIVNHIKTNFDYICTACGTGGTIAGIISSLKGEKKILGFPALKGGEFLENDIRELVTERSSQSYNNWKLITEYHFGGYAKIDISLINFINEFESINNFKLDYIYTSKMFYGIKELLKREYFSKGIKIVLLHTGGIQGNKGMISKVNNLLKNNYQL
ncbi:MAG: 1-aminocyclopropane-1-carboxylate deaminase/D-cysteine desulfhydrase [Melioribacteraceae bacterium]|nr:1-aminocyclopropane-1-carboxylate deaminase/D-cysteine desulfhydrase [Melioribacteraceae bacterium]